MSFDLGGCSGDLKTIVAGGPFHAGMPALDGSQFGVCKNNPDIYGSGDGTGQKVVLRLVGVVMCDVAAETATAGQALYFDADNGVLSIDDTVGPFVACAWDAYASPASGQALVRLNESAADLAMRAAVEGVTAVYGPSATLTMPKRQVIIPVDFTDIEAASNVLYGPTIPNHAIVTRAFYVVKTTFTSATDAATIGIGFATDDAAGIVATTAISAGGNLWDAGAHEGIQDGTVAAFGNKLTADRKVQFIRGGAEALTAGALWLVLEYVTLGA